MPTAVHWWVVHGYPSAGSAAGSTAVSIEPLTASSTKAPAPSAVALSKLELAKAVPTPDSSKPVNLLTYLCQSVRIDPLLLATWQGDHVNRYTMSIMRPADAQTREPVRELGLSALCG